MRRWPAVLAMLAVLGILVLVISELVLAYPLNGYEHTRIRRLWAYDSARRAELGGPSLRAGALMPMQAVRLSMLGSDFDVDADSAPDPELQQQLEELFAGRDPRYSIALLDITDPAVPRYAALRETETYLPGSVGKLLVAGGVFGALAEAFPDEHRRLDVLRDSWITADDFIHTDSHSVPIVDMGAGTLERRPIREGDEFTLFEWLDHALSPSSNAAGATIWKQAMLIRHFGASYPPSAADAAAYFADTPKSELTKQSLRVLEDPLRVAGLDTASLRQGTMFTRGARRYVPGVRSLASPLQLLRLLLRIEQGRLVDEFSSLEIKRLLYFTRTRYRYAVSSALNDAAVYFKSGSFYQCKEEEGFTCRQYAGNVRNVMNSVAIIENPAVPRQGEVQRRYLVAMMSDVLRINSAAEHRDIGTAIDQIIARTAR